MVTLFIALAMLATVATALWLAFEGDPAAAAGKGFDVDGSAEVAEKTFAVISRG